MKTSTKTFAIADTAANADYLTNTSEPLGETMTLNVGPSHPATHGVLRIKLTMDGEFIRRADEMLGHQVEVISGREEARLIYLGVSHTIADTPGKRLVVDIGGGSTEFIVGQRFEPLLRESLQMGCVSFTQRYFKDGKITPARYAQAYTAARLEIMSIEHALHRLTWDEAIGSSGTIRAIGLAITTRPARSTACTWNTRLDRSTPTRAASPRVTSAMTSPFRSD